MRRGTQSIVQDDSAKSVSLLEKLLLNTPRGYVVTYLELTALAGRNVQGDGYGILYRARNRAEKQGVIFGTIVNEGLKRLEDSEIPSSADKAFLRIRHISKKGSRKLNGIQDLAAFNPDDRGRVIAQKSLLNIISTAATEKSIGKLLPACKTRIDYLPTAETLASLEG